MDETLACEALRQCKALDLVYDGLARSVEVHAVGVSRTGKKIMCCWQTRGGSSSGEAVGWKFMELAKVISASISDETSLAPRQGYKAGDKRLHKIVCEL